MFVDGGERGGLRTTEGLLEVSVKPAKPRYEERHETRQEEKAPEPAPAVASGKKKPLSSVKLAEAIAAVNAQRKAQAQAQDSGTL